MTKSVVDLTDMRDAVDGDPEMEQQLIELFIEDSKPKLTILKQQVSEGDVAVWHKTSHALKGLAYNLGASELGDLCMNAQENAEAPSAEKQEMLDKIEKAYAAVHEFLTEHLNTL